jgi:hypothetical protein
MSGPDDPNGRGSKLNPIRDPDSPAGQLARALRELVGGEPLRQLARRVPCGVTTISDALSGDPRKVPSTMIVEGICKACNADPPTQERLLRMRTEAARSKTPDPPPLQPASSDPPPHNSASWKKLKVTLWVAVFGLVTVGIVVWQWWPRECGWFSGIRLNDKADGECIGITDGSYHFNDPNNAANSNDRNTMNKINDVQERIKTENDVVANNDRYVKVVLLMPLTVSRVRPPAISLRQILHSLEGCYTALYRTNHSSNFGDPSAVKIQLLLANQGSRQNADPDFIDGVLGVSQPDHPVVAVIGMGSSVPNTKTAAEYLANKGIPIVNAEASADSLTDLHLLWSVSPSNTDYAKQFKSFLDQQKMLSSGIIVYDRNSDLFTQSLAQAYRDQLGPYVKFPDQPFQGSTLPPQDNRQQPVPNVFLPVVTNVCDAANEPHAPLDMVFYGGRVADFGPFAAALEERICRQRQLTVFVVATAAADARAFARTFASANIRIIAATSSDSLSWGRNEPGTPPGYPAFLAAYHDRGFVDDDGLLDNYAIGHHDALVIAAQAIRLASLGTQTRAPSPEDVAGQFGHLNRAYTVLAAGGTLSFQPEGGRATGRSILIQQIN